jgi:hypothetical protein
MNRESRTAGAIMVRANVEISRLPPSSARFFDSRAAWLHGDLP